MYFYKEVFKWSLWLSFSLKMLQSIVYSVYGWGISAYIKRLKGYRWFIYSLFRAKKPAENSAVGEVTIRRSSRIRQKSGGSETSETSEKPSELIQPTLKPVAENEETLFSPPKINRTYSQPEEEAEEIPNFGFS